jgi:DNA replication protein DnaC
MSIASKANGFTHFDDFGLQPIDPINSSILLELVEDRFSIGSLIITSQIPIEGWYELITEKTIVDASRHIGRIKLLIRHIALVGE